MLLEQPNRLHDDVVEVQGARRAQPPLVLAVDVGHGLLVVRGGLAFVIGRRHEVVLGPADHRRDLPGGIALRVDVHLLEHQRDDPLGVAFVVDREVARHAEVGVLAPKDPGAGRMEREDPHALGHPGPEQALDPLGHLLRGLVGEGDGQDLVGADPALPDQERDPVGQGASLSTAGAGHDEHRALGLQDGFALDRVQRCEQGRIEELSGCHTCDSRTRRRRPGSCAGSLTPTRWWPGVST